MVERGITRWAHHHIEGSFLIISSAISSCPSENFSLNYQIIADYDLTNSLPTVSSKGNYMGINLWYDIDYCCRDNYMHELIDVFPPGDNNQHICTAEQPAVEDGDGETDGSRGARGGATVCRGFIWSSIWIPDDGEEAQSAHMLIWRDIKGSLCRNKLTTSLGSLRHCWKSVTTTAWIRPRQNVTRSNGLWAGPQFRKPDMSGSKLTASLLVPGEAFCQFWNIVCCLTWPRSCWPLTSAQADAAPSLCGL